MAIQITPNRSKITVRVWTPIFEALVERTDAAFLRRDQLISHTLKLELPRIRNELPGPNSAKARRYMEARLRTLFATGAGAKQFSLALDPEVAIELEAVCKDLNIPRDCLLNRLFMLLAASGQFLADRFFHLTPDPLTDSGFQPDETQSDLTPFETPPKRLITKDWFMSGQFDVKGLALDLTGTELGSAPDYDTALAPFGRIGSVVADPLHWYRLMLQGSFEQHAAQFREKGNFEAVSAMESECWAYTPFGMNFDNEPEMDGLNCHMPDSALDQSVPVLLPKK